MKNVIIVLSIIALPACATNYGSQQVQNFGAYSELEKGETSKLEVYDKFGQPHDVDYFPTGESVWTYFSVRMKASAATFIPFIGIVAGGADTDTTTASFFFDREDVFAKVETSTKSKYINQWVGMASAASENDEMDRVSAEMEKYELPFDQEIAREMKGTSGAS
jgi:outer membrane protein assembly factor BamE (lipoprotein component of BamABCDE complex)